MTADQLSDGWDQSQDQSRDQQLPFDVQPGDVIFQSPAAVVDPAGFVDSADVTVDDLQKFMSVFGNAPGVLAEPGLPGADALLVLEVQDGAEPGAEPGTDGTEPGRDSAESSTDGATIIAVQLGLMSSEAAANHMPALADRLTKPKVFFIGGNQEPVVLAVGLLDSDRLELDATPTPAPTRFGKRGQFLLISTAESAPSVDEQVAEVVGHVDPSMLRGLRLFHSYVRLEVEDLRTWVETGLVGVQAATAEDVFTDRPAETWRQLMKKRPFPDNLFVTWASHPERN
ncbi:hypothetical protein HMPREF2678_04785 [Corynebacterium sp. HMSC058E07]|uniref:hypothetical protein n=1 Tax=Corynebacterium sp. HMSC058E07 TaxID=1715157 RepID=UPI0008A60AC6|nr:hypothetical protein [Corynebacterium sp. HMSC058E07]OFM60279.1 hypothetical protein HMPREF2678_04785 [Corynebacterium sp. HMSC058E07]